jgi:hypothetical protein
MRRLGACKSTSVARFAGFLRVGAGDVCARAVVGEAKPRSRFGAPLLSAHNSSLSLSLFRHINNNHHVGIRQAKLTPLLS